MVDPITARDPEYSLTESAILSSWLLSAATSSVALARPETVPDRPEISVTQKVVFRRRTPEGVLVVEASGAVPRSFQETVEDVLDLLDLPPGWNSYSAKPIALPTVVRVIKFLADLIEADTPRPLVVPRVRGGIQLEWHMSGVDIEIYFDSPESIRFFAAPHGADEGIEHTLAGHEEELKAWLHQIS